MSSEIELDDPSGKQTSLAKQENPERPYESTEARDSVVSLWVFTAAAILAISSLILMLAPRLLLFTAEASTERRNTLTPLESFLATHFGIFLSAIAINLVLCIPSSLPITPPQQTGAQGHPLLSPITIGSLISSFLAYNTNYVGPLALLTCLATGVIGLFGLWTMVFAGSSRISRKTGADKRTSAFIFGNRNAASKQKKQWKKEQRVAR